MITEDKLEYSDPALSVKHAFFNKTVMLYVEGKTDITFWDERFRKFGIPSEFYEIQDVGGKNELLKIKKEIIGGSVNNIIIACDSDYLLFVGNKELKDPRIITTFGHSIENTMFCPVSVAVYMRRILHKSTDCRPDVEKWFSDFSSSVTPLLPYDIENAVPAETSSYSKPQVLGKGFERFLKKGSTNLDDKVINDFISKNDGLYDKKRITCLAEKLKVSGKEIRLIVQGHFLMGGVAHFLRHVYKSEMKKSNELSDVAFYSAFAYCLDESKCGKCADRDYLKEQIHAAYHYFGSSVGSE